MGQWLAALGPDAEQAAGWLRRGVDAFRQVAGLAPEATLEAGGVAVAAFPYLEMPGAGLVRVEETSGWITGAGAWFYEGRAGAEGLRRMAVHTHAPAGDASWLRDTDGAFAIVLGGSTPGEAVVCTDRLGTLHVYAAHVDGCTLVSTSALVLARLLRPAWNPAALRYYFSYGNLFESHSLFRGIEKLPPARLLRFKPGKLAEEICYWPLAEYCWDRAGEQGGVEPVRQALREGMRMIGSASRTPVLDLTGGFDSRGLLGAMLEAGCSFDTIVNGEEEDGDVRVAGLLAREFGLRHRHRRRDQIPAEEIWALARRAVPLLDGEFDALLYASTMHTHLHTSREFSASINGSNGEICKGQYWELLLPHIGSKGHFDAKLVSLKRFAMRDVYPGLLAASFPESLVEDLAGVIRRTTAGMEAMPNTALLDTCYLRMRMQRWQGRIASATGRIWPCYSPYAFRAPMEAALATPPGLRVRHRLSRRLIEAQSRRLAELPLAQGYPALPLRWDTAHRFGPLAVEMGDAVWRRLRRMLGGAPAVKAPPTYPLRRLEGLEEVRALLEPRLMLTRELYEPRVLEAVLARSRQAEAGYEIETAGRILSLELTARTIAG